MTTSTESNIMVTQKKSFDLYNGQHYRVCLKTFNLKRHLKQSARNVCDQIEVFFSSQNKDRAIFNIVDLKKKCGYKDDRTILTSLAKINELGVFFIRDLSDDEFIIFTPKDENIKLIEKIDENNDEYLTWLLKNTKEVGKINKKLENLKSKAKSLFSGIVKKHQHVKKQHGYVKKQHGYVKKQHEHEYSYLLELGDIQVFNEVQSEALDLLFLDLFSIDHQSLDQKNQTQEFKASIENQTQALKKNDDDFSNKFEEEEEEKEKAKPSKNISQEIKDNSNDKDDLTHTQKVSGGAVAVPPAGDELIKELFGNEYVDKEIKELVYLFKNATWYNPETNQEENFEFNLFEAKKIIINSTNYNVIRNAIKYLPSRDLSDRENPNPAGYLRAEILAGGYAPPKDFFKKESQEKQKKEEDLYTKIVNIWGYIGKMNHLYGAYHEINKIINTLLQSNKIDFIKEKIQETAKYISPSEVIKKDYLQLVGAV